MDETIERFDVVKCFKVPVISSIIVLEISVTIILIGVHGPPVMSFVFSWFFSFILETFHTVLIFMIIPSDLTSIH